ncbi:hypothetical protein OHA40_08655 [Nocardia sp. NBC_00508]|uniref:hypothetical protein n=1 Tax=Nocardia sp. NBC_00508 TaxID=2975992 RepID=UPI002E81255E|nr:hypothetical protein [Nocardia sp. NBC_00508]WUD68171.1 hypothetical protein OHA40_08655 [Nocardia sp. NBC_00508]
MEKTLRNNISRLSISVAALGAMLISGAGSTIANASPSGPLVIDARRQLCDNGFIFSKPTIIRPEVHADAWAKCDIPRDGDPGLTHDYYLSLQRLSNSGQWESVGEHVRTRLVPWSRRTHTATAPCVPGKWRMYAQVVGTIQGRPYGPIETISGTRDVSADDCKIGG